MSSYYISELDNKPIERKGSGWFTSKAKATSRSPRRRVRRRNPGGDSQDPVT